MNKSMFKRIVKDLLNDIKEGYIGMPEVMEELWGYFEDLQSRSEDLWKEVKRLRNKKEKAYRAGHIQGQQDEIKAINSLKK